MQGRRGARKSLKPEATSTAPVPARCSMSRSRSMALTATCVKKGKIAELALGYGGSVGALKAMGAIEMGLTEDELPPLVDAWRQTNPNIIKFWWDVGRAVMEAVKYKHTTSSYGLTFSCRLRDALYRTALRTKSRLCKAESRYQ